MKRSSIIVSLLVPVFPISDARLQNRFQNDHPEFTERFIFISGSYRNCHLFDPQSGNYLLKHNSNRLFVPASNVKLQTLYAGMKYLGERLPGMLADEQKDTVYLLPYRRSYLPASRLPATTGLWIFKTGNRNHCSSAVPTGIRLHWGKRLVIGMIIYMLSTRNGVLFLFTIISLNGLLKN